MAQAPSTGQWGARLLLFFVFFLRNDARERLILKEGTR